jgi:hypothetical protein
MPEVHRLRQAELAQSGGEAVEFTNTKQGRHRFERDSARMPRPIIRRPCGHDEPRQASVLSETLTGTGSSGWSA